MIDVEKGDREFLAYSVVPGQALTCTSLPDGTATARMNNDYPTDAGWRIDPSGPGRVDCPVRPTTHHHLRFTEASDDYIRRLIDERPPLTDEQRTQLAALLRPYSPEREATR